MLHKTFLAQLLLIILCACPYLISLKAEDNEDKLGTPIRTLPYTITTPGVYSVASDLTTTIQSGSSITVLSDAVTINFDGHTLSNTNVANTAEGVYVPDHKNVTVRNGTVKGFWIGIDFPSSAGNGSLSSGHVVEEMAVRDNSWLGIRVFGNSNTIQRCQVTNVGGSTAMADKSGYGIVIQGGAGSRAIDNDVTKVQPGSSSFVGFGICLIASTDTFVVQNRISQTQYGVYYDGGSTGKYRENLIASSVATRFSGGTDVGGNFADDNNNNIEDQWERNYFGDLSHTDPNEDYDGDGLTNLQEFLQGTNPTDSYNNMAPFLAGTTISSSQSNLAWNLSGIQPARIERWIVERKLSNASNSSYASVGSSTNNGSINAIVDQNLTAGTSYSYRVRAFRTGALGGSGGGYSPYSNEAIVTVPQTFVSDTGSKLPTDSLLLWLRADLGVNVDSKGVLKWTDASGHGLDAVAPINTASPQKISNAILNKPAVRFDGSSAYLQLPTGFDNFDEGLTAIIVTKPTGLRTTYQRFFDFGTDAGSNNLLFCREAQTDNLLYDSFAAGQLTTSINAANAIKQESNQILEVTHGKVGGSVDIYTNGVLALHSTSTAAAIQHVVRTNNFIGRSNWAGDGLFQGDIAEVLIFNKALNNAERLQFETYLSRKYGLPLAPIVTITDPLANSAFNTSRIDVHGRVAFAMTPDNVSVNTVRATVTGNTWTARNVPLQAGSNTLTATATDGYGYVGSTSIILSASNSSQPLIDPVALASSVSSGIVPLTVTLQAVTAAPGQILSVQYDFDGDGIIDLTKSDLQPTSFTYQTAGDFFPVTTVVTSTGSFSSLGGHFSTDTARVRIHTETPPRQQVFTAVTSPIDIKVARNGHVFVLSSSNATITEFDLAGSAIRSVAGLASTPNGFDVDNNGNVYVALTGSNQVSRFLASGTTFTLDASFNNVGFIGRADKGMGTASSEFNQPYDVAVSAGNDVIYVTDRLNHRVQEFTTGGVFVASIGGIGTDVGQFNSPQGISFGTDGSVYVADTGNNRVEVIRGQDVVDAFGSQGGGLQQFQAPSNVYCDASGIYVADTGNNRVLKFESLEFDGSTTVTNFQALWNSMGRFDLSGPRSIAAGGSVVEEWLYIADTGHNQIVKAILPRPDPTPVWNNAVAKLNSGDIEGALTGFSVGSTTAYRRFFQTVGSSQLQQWLHDVGTLTPVYIENDQAQYRFTYRVGSTDVTFFVTFSKENGQWKIVEF